MEASLRLLALPILAVLGGCKPVDPVPADLDGLQHWFFDAYDVADALAFSEAVDQLHVALDGDSLADALDGSATDLTDEQIAFSGRDDVDPAAAAGSFLGNTFACDIDTLAAVLSYVDQNELYGVYDAYERTYTTDHDAWIAHEADAIDWDVRLDATILGAEYSEDLEGGLRRFDTSFGDALVSRTWMTDDAEFREGSAKEWPQDWQIEVYYEAGDDRIVHLYGMWRQMRLGTGLTTDDESVLRIILNNLVDWDTRTEELCALGPP